MIGPADTPPAGGTGDRPGAREVTFAPRAAKELRKLPAEVQRHVVDALRRFAADGHGDVRKLTDVRPPMYRLRVGDFRVFFSLSPGRLEVERIANRREAY